MNKPKHIAVIMDGNGRWAKQKGYQRSFGHQEGTKATIDLVDKCVLEGIDYLTIYVFSSENWNRPIEEVKFLIELLLLKMIDQELPHMMDKSVRLKMIGDLSMLPQNSREKLEVAIEQTSKNTGMQLNLAISYSGRKEITHAMKSIASKIKSGQLDESDIDEELVAKHLYLPNVPDPDLIVRTGGEKRISNYLLWQSAYSELYFTDVLWPDFTPEELDKALDFYSHCNRRFGKVVDE